ncbi:uncharacterized protein TNCT_619061 [Trichonephila clavata]|uniref:Uncharacterized protein n=1 Tax=Trichonephila clavata TaxID=2740835 RepID=A0A8X6GHE4_TRICU|nr:uncharacterized protein TNCT_619061 [Trichonephila clavata]
MQHRVDVCTEWKGRLEQEGDNILKPIITADKVRLYHYDPTIKQQSSKWKHLSSPTPKKANCEIGCSYYANVLRTMVQHVKRKHPLLQKRLSIAP